MQVVVELPIAKLMMCMYAQQNYPWCVICLFSATDCHMTDNDSCCNHRYQQQQCFLLDGYVHIKISIHLCHMIAHPSQLHGCSHQIELVQAGDVSIEGIPSTGFDVLVAQGVVDAGSALTDDFLEYGVVHAAQQQHFLADILIHAVLAALVAHVRIKVFYFRVDFPLRIP